ncbi:hypothetical protein GCM10027568_23140 [Humibacter soli]
MPSHRPARIGFLLSQLGAHASRRFDERVAELGLTAQQAGVLRILGRQPGVSQRDLADRLGLVQSRMVALIDGLERDGLVARTRSEVDRRSYRLTLTDQGTARLDELRAVAEAHEAELAGQLTAGQRDELYGLLRSLAGSLDVDVEVHEGYRAFREQQPEAGAVDRTAGRRAQ